MTTEAITSGLSRCIDLVMSTPNVGMDTLQALHEAVKVCHEVEGLRQENLALRARVRELQEAREDRVNFPP